MSSSTYYAKIIAADGVFFKGQVRSLIIPEIDGEKEILAHHEDMVIAVYDGELRFQEEEGAEWRRAVVGRGFLEIANNRVTLLVESAERPEDIDIARAKAAKERAEEQLRQKQSVQEYYHSSASLARAMARLKATSGGKHGINFSE
ncbi:F-type H+-transporting ATPase subunit epsilon [Lachnospiraceae bacterium A10]|jgi:F-type H+-transporting ATPase subunit epsilon|nr:F-type H+-transporting ATPase subunit epsilon [Lachnospiraceae bacterium A10]